MTVSSPETRADTEDLRGRCKLLIVVALPGLEPGLFALRGRRVNQLHHNAVKKLRVRRRQLPQPLRLAKYSKKTGDRQFRAG